MLGSGPGGYTAAFRAADLGKKVVLVERYPTLGGVCLNVGCIPSKALLHAAKVIAEAREMGAHGLAFGAPEIDLDKLADWKDGVVGRLTGGLAGLAKQRKVQVVQGVGRFASPNQLEVASRTAGHDRRLRAGDHRRRLGGDLPAVHPASDDPRIMDSTGGARARGRPERLLVLGGGIIGLEMATVYHELGSKITVVELMDQLIPGVDPDIIRPLHKRIEKLYENILLGDQGDRRQGRARRASRSASRATKAPETDIFDTRPGRGRPAAERQGDRAPMPRASRSTSAASSRSTGSSAPTSTTSSRSATWSASRCSPTRRPTRARSRPRSPPARTAIFDVKCIPSVAYTDPEVAWAGLTETEAKAQRRQIRQGQLPLGGLGPRRSASPAPRA